jgi:hypothetical protein
MGAKIGIPIANDRRDKMLPLKLTIPLLFHSFISSGGDPQDVGSACGARMP